MLHRRDLRAPVFARSVTVDLARNTGSKTQISGFKNGKRCNVFSSF